MRWLKWILVLFALTSISDCPGVYFQEPQPPGAKNLNSFPKKLRGKYYSLPDSMILTVDERLMVLEDDSIFDMPKDEMGDSFYFVLEAVKDTFISLGEGEKIRMIFLGETQNDIRMHWYITDTIFYLSEPNVLRKWRGNYYLNSLQDKEFWEVKKLQEIKNKIVIGSTIKEDEKYLLELISPVDSTYGWEDTTYIFKPTKSEFKKFLEKGGFRKSQEFTRSE